MNVPIALRSLTLALLAAAPLAALDSHIAGPRALGLGGAGTAAADDHNASWYNPAIYGFFARTGEEDARLPADPNFIGRKDWGVGLVDAGLGIELRGRVADYVEQLAGIDFQRLEDMSGPDATPDDLKSAVVLATMLQRFEPAADLAVVQSQVGILNTRVLQVGIGLRQTSEAIVSIADLDRSNLGIGLSGGGINAQINNAGGAPAGWTQTLILPGSQAETNLSGLGLDSQAILNLDYAASQAGLSLADIEAIAGSGSGALIGALSGTGDIRDNQTAVFTGGFALAEVPLTIGWAINDHLAVGGSLKLMVGRVAGAKARVYEGVEDLPDLIQEAFDSAEQTVTGGLDLGVAARWSWGQVGLAGRNLNRPVLQGSTFRDADGNPFRIEDVELDPQVAVGIALYPFETVVLTADLDLIENETELVTVSGNPNLPVGASDRTTVRYATQRLGGGIEWNAFRFLALRLGASTDLAESEQGPMVHGGIGLNLWAIRFDLAAAAATETVVVDGEEYPRAVHAAAGLAIDF